MGPINGRRSLLLAAVALAGAAVGSVTAQTGKGPDYFNPKNFNPSMAIVMLVLVTAFFLLGFFSIYLRRCAGAPLGGSGTDDDEYPLGLGLGRVGAGITSASSRRMRGLDRAVLDAFPTMAYADVRAHKAKAGKGAALECAVCLTEFDDDDTLRLLPRCAHAFHTDCIDAWLASHVTCPVCRALLDPAALAAVPATEVIPPIVPAAPPDRAVVVVDAASGETETEDQRVRREEAAELMRIGSVKRALRTKSGRRPAQFRRSHTTGHSPSSTSDSDSERYTLRLPDHLLREAVAAGNLRRSASVQTGGGGDGTTTRRAGRSVRLGNSGRWPNMSLLARTFSARLPVWGSARRGEADAPAKGAKFAGDDGKAAVEQCDGGACSLGAHV
ncbi:E3 ubiquitin-protein ligase ATL6-like [Miscanthus floridulus]|uniref:E3 ubiquitin-protein ligase ATL6-like n=1 Tax=Miscanthus floridulus TaxID=154761 RepID=UPI003458D654